ncbi:MAG: A/G-specific adenine glycosylase [Legionella sp.]|nr:A/G-specific adenine glycosylase [Legionella sp.]
MQIEGSDLESNFTKPLLTWFDIHGRKSLPWQNPRTPYRVWISEIMLQQTQVKTVIPYFDRFMERFPEIQDLANASEEEVLAVWSGLGYYSRARNLFKTAQIISTQYNGCFPPDHKLLERLPGIGPSTAAAITSQAFNHPNAILDGNVKRVLTRYFRVEGFPNQTKTHKKLWDLAQQCMDKYRCADYTQAIMDLGATCCTRNKPSCGACPVRRTCGAFLHEEVQVFPNKKIKKQLPTKRQQFILLHTADNDIYLEKRASKGLWGGLWCCPMLDGEQEETFFEQYAEERLGLTVIKWMPLIDFKHSFSHFHLEIQASTLHVQSPVEKRYGVPTGNDVDLLQVAEPRLNFASRLADRKQLSEGMNSTRTKVKTLEGRWFNVRAILDLGIPQPLRRIITSYLSNRLL